MCSSDTSQVPYQIITALDELQGMCNTKKKTAHQRQLLFKSYWSDEESDSLELSSPSMISHPKSCSSVASIISAISESLSCISTAPSVCSTGLSEVDASSVVEGLEILGVEALRFLLSCSSVSSSTSISLISDCGSSKRMAWDSTSLSSTSGHLPGSILRYSTISSKSSRANTCISVCARMDRQVRIRMFPERSVRMTSRMRAENDCGYVLEKRDSIQGLAYNSGATPCSSRCLPSCGCRR
mmetsp:Transcript_747/g.2912  ORF Transcript_747/g.2912 Transcript_747/m.2912 type:complete len:241 (+) Transcript_747:511-1233(+)